MHFGKLIKVLRRIYVATILTLSIVFSVDETNNYPYMHCNVQKLNVYAQNPDLTTCQGTMNVVEKKRKNAVYYQDISFDTVLVSEPFSLTAFKAIPQAKIKFARSRLLAMQKFLENQQN